MTDYYTCKRCGTFSSNPKSCCREYEGMLFRFVRRRYAGRQTYTWAFVRNSKNEWVTLGDPYPAVTFQRKMLVEFGRKKLASQQCKECGSIAQLETCTFCDRNYCSECIGHYSHAPLGVD